MGFNVRTLGLACDQITALRLVNYKGDVLAATQSSNSDLLWASCGGGGGSQPLTFPINVSMFTKRCKQHTGKSKFC